MQPNRKKLIIVAGVIVMLVVIGGLLVQQIPATVSAPLFVLVVVMEVIIAPIPGGAIGYLGAARYGFWTAWPLLYIGNIIGTTIAFLLARKVGAPIFEENVSDKTRARYDALLEGHPLLLWGVYTVPLIPVDILSVLAGLSHMPARKFLLIAYTGFFFYTAIVAYVGSFLAQFIGVTEAMSAIGGLFLVVLAVWLWRHQRQPAS
jgi:uncharacterized membrane protein YdjX (TVP38/TMEM64 family)